jgi:hypothetical protein
VEQPEAGSFVNVADLRGICGDTENRIDETFHAVPFRFTLLSV